MPKSDRCVCCVEPLTRTLAERTFLYCGLLEPKKLKEILEITILFCRNVGMCRNPGFKLWFPFKRSLQLGGSQPSGFLGL